MRIEKSIVKFCYSKWKLDELDSIIDQWEDQIDQEAQRKQLKDTDLYKMTVLHIIGKCVITMREIIILCGSGYADGAFSLSRNLYEQFILLAFFIQHERDSDFREILEDYELDAYYKDWKNRKAEFELLYPNKTNDELEKELEDILKKAHHKPSNSSNSLKDYWWAGKNTFRDMEDEIKTGQDKELVSILHEHYRESCLTLHANCKGNAQRIGFSDEYHIINTSLTMTGQKMPLLFATMSIIAIVCQTCVMFDLDYKKYRTALNKLAKYYKKQNVDESY